MTTTFTDNENWAAPWAANGNGDVLKDLGNKVFFGKWESLYIAQAVENSMRVGDPTLPLKDVKVGLMSRLYWIHYWMFWAMIMVNNYLIAVAIASQGSQGLYYAQIVCKLNWSRMAL